METTYTTSQIAKIIGVHPNTVRKYADLGLIPKPIRKANGYRVFCNIHIDQFRLARTAFQIEVLQGGLRKKIISIVKISAKGHYDDAIALTHEYVAIAEAEIVNANEAVEIADKLLKKPIHENIILLKRKEVSDVIGVSMDTLRNWEMNGILKIKRKENGYRVYDNDDINKLKIIRSLRCANYSLSSILRLMNAFFENEYVDPKYVLNTPNGNEYIVSVCDKLIISLTIAKQNAEKIIELLIEMKNNYPNHTL
ncbi:MAG: MerR family transcriptional regulator [Chloroflexi bacterium HGW-Chloroflexi-5]|nr:MAG: MerR family transcriptional regulator [Chloroflexi bacterium HGW-Chloroflexi-5]